MYLIPALLQASISFALIGREASVTSVSPRQNFLKPPPVPEIPTVTRTFPLWAFWNSSATASVIGNTVLEPSTLTMAAAVAVAGAPARLAPITLATAVATRVCLKFMYLSPA